MKLKNLFKDKLLEEIIKMCVISLFYIGFNHVFLSKDDWWSNITQSLVLLCTSLLYFLVVSSVYIFKRPIHVNLELKNYKTDENETQIRGDGRQGSAFNTIIIKMAINERSSAWSGLALKMIKNKKINLGIFVDPKNSGLICQSAQLHRGIIEQAEQGFYICINDHLDSNLDKNVPVTDDFNFMITQNRDILVNRVRRFTIKPVILCNKASFNLFMKLFIKLYIRTKEQYHTIKLIE